MKPVTLAEVEAYLAEGQCAAKPCNSCAADRICYGVITRYEVATQLATTMRELATEREARGRMEAVVEAARDFREALDSANAMRGPAQATWDTRMKLWAALDAQRIAGEQ